MSPVDESLFDRDYQVIQQRYGQESIHSAGDMVDVDRIPLDLPGIMRITSSRRDDGTTVAGIPIGRVTRVYGDTSSGKSLIVLYCVAAAQALRTKRFPEGLSCCLWNTEASFDPIHAASYGVDVDALKILELSIIEDIAAAMELLLASRHLHVIDSASFAEPMEELVGKDKSKNPEYQVQVGAHARAWKRAINRIHARMDQESNVLLVVDHMGKDIATGADRPLSGRRMEYRSDLSLHVKRGPWLFYNKHGHLDTSDKIKATEGGFGPAGMKEPDGQEISVRVAKSRVCRPFRACKMRLDLNTLKFDTLWELADSADYFDDDGNPAHRSGKPAIVSKSSNGYYSIEGYKKTCHGFDAFYETLRGDPILQDRIRAAMLRGN